MKLNGDWDITDVPRFMRKWRERGPNNNSWGDLLGARAGLLDGCETIMESAEKESRGLTADERSSFDEYAAQIAEINAELAKIKARLIAERGADFVHVPF